MSLDSGSNKRHRVQWIGLVLGPVIAIVVYLLLPNAGVDSSGKIVPFTFSGRVTASLAVWMAIWWMTEAISIYATALLPLAVLPLSGASTIREAASPYGHEMIYLFMGGFIVALAMERWGLHKRFAFVTLRIVGTRPRNLVAGFMGITAFVSMWVSNTATTIMMLPIGMSIVDLSVQRHTGESLDKKKGIALPEIRNFSLCLLLGIAYAASIGGIGTLIGTPPNLFLASYIKDNLGQEISFVRWMGIGVPLVLVFLPIAWVLLTKVIFPIGKSSIKIDKSYISREIATLGPMSKGEWAVLVVFVATAALWMSRPILNGLNIDGTKPLAGITDAGVAIMAALVLFVIPADISKRDFVMNWKTAAKLPWGILVLFGGGLSLASALRVNGVSEQIGYRVQGLVSVPEVLLVVFVVTIMVLVTELTSNTAATAALVPIFAAVAPALGVNPYLMIVPAAMGASCAFMLPVATPPNAIVYGSGLINIAQMLRAGVYFVIVGIVLITLITYGFAMPFLTGLP